MRRKVLTLYGLLVRKVKMYWLSVLAHPLGARILKRRVRTALFFCWLSVRQKQSGLSRFAGRHEPLEFNILLKSCCGINQAPYAAKQFLGYRYRDSELKDVE